MSKPRKKSEQFFIQISESGFNGRLSGNYYDVTAYRYFDQLLSHRFPKPAFNPVPCDSIPDFSADGQSDPADRETIRSCVQDKITRRKFAALVKDVFKIPFFTKRGVNLLCS